MSKNMSIDNILVIRRKEHLKSGELLSDYNRKIIKDNSVFYFNIYKDIPYLENYYSYFSIDTELIDKENKIFRTKIDFNEDYISNFYSNIVDFKLLILELIGNAPFGKIPYMYANNRKRVIGRYKMGGIGYLFSDNNLDDIEYEEGICSYVPLRFRCNGEEFDSLFGVVAEDGRYLMEMHRCKYPNDAGLLPSICNYSYFCFDYMDNIIKGCEHSVNPPYGIFSKNLKFENSECTYILDVKADE